MTSNGLTRSTYATMTNTRKTEISRCMSSYPRCANATTGTGTILQTLTWLGRRCPPSAILHVEFVELFLRELVVARLVFRLHAVGFRCNIGLRLGDVGRQAPRKGDVHVAKDTS